MAYKSLCDLTLQPNSPSITFSLKIHTVRVVLLFLVLLCSCHAILHHYSFAHTVPSGWNTLPPLFYLPYDFSLFQWPLTTRYFSWQLKLGWYLPCVPADLVTPVKFNFFFLKLHLCFWL